MPRKKKEESESAKLSGADLVEQRIKDTFGENILVRANYITDSRDIVVPVSPMLDGILNGGIPFGSFVLATGPPKIGKTSMFLDFGATALQVPSEFGEDRRMYYLSIEGRLKERDMEGIHHLKPYIGTEKFSIVRSEKGKILDAEEFLNIAEDIINNVPGAIVILDSFSSLCSTSGKTKEWDGKEYRDNVPKMLSLFCKRISNVIPVNKSIVMGVTHQIANTGFGFSSWAEASGTKVQYQVDTKLKASHNTAWKDGDATIGIDVYWECLCSPLHNGPLADTKCISKFRFGYGIDKAAELINVAVDLGIIKKGGAWYEFPDGTKYQGLEKATLSMRENEELYNSINKEYREMMGLSCM